jgi:hypothetical protein
MVDRYLVDKGPDQLKVAFKGIVSLCENRGICAVTLVVPTKNRWEHTETAKFLGLDVAKALLRGNSVELAEGITMTLESAQTFRSHTYQGLLVGAHISVEDMSKLDDSFGAKALMYIPWTGGDEQEWRKTWRPETLGPSPEAASQENLPLLVEEALRELTERVNLGTGLVHPSDKEDAQRVMTQLKADGHSFDPAEVRRWARRNGWSSHAAKDLEKIAQKRRKRHGLGITTSRLVCVQHLRAVCGHGHTKVEIRMEPESYTRRTASNGERRAPAC